MYKSIRLILIFLAALATFVVFPQIKAYWLAHRLIDADPQTRAEATQRLVSAPDQMKRRVGVALKHSLYSDAIDHRQFAGAAFDLIAVPARDTYISILRDLDGSDMKRRKASRALESIQSFAKESVLALLPVTQDKSKLVRLAAIAAVGLLSRGTELAVPTLAEAANDPDVDIRRQTAKALEAIGPTVPAAAAPLAQLLLQPNDEIRDIAERALIAFSTGAIVVQNQIEMSLIEPSDPKLHVRALRIFTAMKPTDPGILRSITFSLDDNSEDVRKAAGVALIAAGVDGASEIVAKSESLFIGQDYESFFHRLSDSDPNVRSRALARISEWNSERRNTIIPTLIEGFKEGREGYDEALFQMRFDAAPAVRHLLHDNRDSVRLKAADFFRTFPNIDLGVVDDLVLLLQDPNQDVAVGAIRALAAMDRYALAALAPLQKLAEDKDSPLKVPAREALNKIASYTPAGIRADIEELSSSDWKIRGDAAARLGELGHGATAALPKLLPLFEDSNVSVKLVAITAAAKIGPDNPEVVQALLAVINQNEPTADGYGVAIRALADMDSKLQSVESVLIGVLKNPQVPQWWKAEALRGLGRFQSAEALSAIAAYGKQDQNRQ